MKAEFNCQHCGLVFMGRSDRERIYCSRVCRGLAEMNPLSTCRHCHKMYRPKFPDRKNFCSRACFYVWQQQNKKVPIPRVPKEQRCTICDSLFVAPRSRSTCGDACYKKQQSQYHRDRASRRKNISARPCKICQQMFSPEYGNKKRHVCSEECTAQYLKIHRKKAKIKRKAILLNVKLELFSDKEIFARDKWKCGICGKRTSKNVKVPKQDAPTIDHIVPLSRGGAHTRANVRCAHFICNLRRGNRGWAQQNLFDGHGPRILWNPKI
jgi:5-methylcytosine-specific restriction endonuclease McrA